MSCKFFGFRVFFCLWHAFLLKHMNIFHFQSKSDNVFDRVDGDCELHFDAVCDDDGSKTRITDIFS